MRTIQRSVAAVVVLFVLAEPAIAASRPSRRTGVVEAVKRFIIRVTSRISPPIGSPTAPSDDTTSTSDTPTKTQQTQ